jgi:uncharacterized membrane protein
MVPGGRVLHGQIKSHAGPLPAREDFGAHDVVLPGAAARILTMAEADAQHIRDIEEKAARRIHGKARSHV